MRSTIIAAALLSLASLSSGALAEAAADIRAGLLVTTSDGKRVGRIYDVEKANDGSVTRVAIIRDNAVIHIAASTLTASDKGLTTSLSYGEVKKLI